MRKWIVALLFFISGAAGLTYEVTWVRMFTTVFGNTVYATSAVLSAFMLGLALGSYWIGRWTPRLTSPLRMYGLLELGIALCAVLMPVAIQLSYPMYAFIYNHVSSDFYFLTAVRFLVACLFLLPPTFFMGGTLPVLAQALVSDDRKVGRWIGGLYALNTFGATVGCFLAGFAFIAILGVKGTVYLGVLLNLFVGLLGLLLSFRFPPRVPVTETSTPVAPPTDSTLSPDSTVPIKVILFGYGLSGLTAMGYEIVWTRLLTFFLGTTTYAFSAMLVTFLFGMALGSALASPRMDRMKSPPRTFALLEVLLGLASLAGMFLLAQLAVHFNAIGNSVQIVSWHGKMAFTFLISVAVMLPSTLILGALFPVAGRWTVKGANRVGQGVGSAYAYNTCGCILGAALTGFFILPALGSVRTMILLIGLNIFVAVLVYVFMTRRWFSRMAYAAYGTVFFLAALLAIPNDLFHTVFVSTLKEGNQLLFWDEGPSATVTVHRYDSGVRRVSTDGVNVAGTSFNLRATQILQANLPLLLHPNPQEVLQIGFGSGETAKNVLLYNPRRFDCAEICDGIIKAAPFFDDINGKVYNNPQFHLKLNDAKNYVLLTPNRYDVIMNDSIMPFLAGNSALYTRDYFQACRDRLNPGGIMSSWVPLDMRMIDLRTIFKTFQDVFPDSTLWLPLNYMSKHALVIGFRDGVKIDFPALKRRAESAAIRNHLAEFGVGNPFALLSYAHLDPEGLRKFSADGLINTDDRPYLEFYAARRNSLEMDVDMMGLVIQSIYAFRTSITPYLVRLPEADAAQLNKYIQAAGFIMKGIVVGIQYDVDQEKQLIQRAIEINPGDTNAQSLLRQEATRFADYLKPVSNRSQDPVQDIFDRAKALWGKGQFPEAAAEFEKFLAKRPDDFQAHANLGAVYGQMEQYPKAIQELQTALKLRPDWPDALYNLGLALLSVKKVPEAEAAFRKLLAANPGKAEERTEVLKYAPYAYEQLGFIALRRGRTDQAVAEYQNAVKAAPGYAPPHMELGKIFEKAKRNSDALTEYQAVVRLDPDNPDGYFLLARLYDRLGNREKSLETLNAGVKATNHPKLRKIRDQLQAKTAAASQ